jgi:hypothetical protein
MSLVSGGKLFSIHSVYSDRELIFRAQKEDRMEIELRGSDLSALLSVWLYTGVVDLNAYFEKLASFKQPWQGAHTWASLEGEFSLSATCATLGQVTFLVKLRHAVGSPEDWRLEYELVTELGQLEKIAKNAKVFFQ